MTDEEKRIKHNADNQKWRENNVDRIKAYRKRYLLDNAEKVAKYRLENTDKINAIMRTYYINAMAARKKAKKVCPVFRLMLVFQKKNPIAYRALGADRAPFVQRAVKDCVALQTWGECRCPMVENPDIKSKDFRDICPMKKTLEIIGALDGVRKQAVILHNRQK